jgi:hypothetical protein
MKEVAIMKVDKIFILAALVASGSAQAASLVDAKGQVWVGREKGFDLVQGAAELSPGDKVKVGSKSVARVVYPDGCSVTVKANSLATVAKHSPCSFNAQVGGADGDLSGNLMLGIGGTALVGGALAGAGILTSGGGADNTAAAALLFAAGRAASP